MQQQQQVVVMVKAAVGLKMQQLSSAVGNDTRCSAHCTAATAAAAAAGSAASGTSAAEKQSAPLEMFTLHSLQRSSA
jgi:hypothetical protein